MVYHPVKIRSSKSHYPSQNAPRFQIRLPDGMRDQIKHSAKRNCRSMNSEIVAIIAKHFDENLETKADTLSDMDWRIQDIQSVVRKILQRSEE